MDKQRVLWIDYAKAIAIYCVVLLHAGIPDPYKGIIRVFLIPLFFFLSGIFSNPDKYKNTKDFLRKKGSKILISYFFFNFVTFLFWLFIGRKFGLDKELNISPLIPLMGIIGGMYKFMLHYIPLWFLATLFSVELIHYLVFKHIKSNIATFTILLGIVFIGYLNYFFNSHSLPWGIDIAMPMLGFYVIGNKTKKLLLKQNINDLLLIATGIVSFLVVFIMYKYNDEVKVFTNFYGNYLMFYIGAFSGIIFSISIFKLLETHTRHIRFLKFVGENTLIILAFHLIASSIIKGFMIYILKINYLQYEGGVLYTLIFSAACVVILIPVIFLINKYLPFVVGKKDLELVFRKLKKQN